VTISVAAPSCVLAPAAPPCEAHPSGPHDVPPRGPQLGVSSPLTPSPTRLPVRGYGAYPAWLAGWGARSSLIRPTGESSATLRRPGHLWFSDLRSDAEKRGAPTRQCEHVPRNGF